MGFFQSDRFAQAEQGEPAAEVDTQIEGLNQTVGKMMAVVSAKSDAEGLDWLKDATSKLDTVKKVIIEGPNALPQEAQEKTQFKEEIQKIKATTEIGQEEPVNENTSSLGLG